MSENNLAVPAASAGDHALAVVRAAIGSVPVAGSAALELFNAIVTPPLERRRTEWMESVASELQRLANNGALSLETLLGNEQFVDAVLEASQAAIRTSNAEKRLALKNAVANSALPSCPDESLQKIYFRLVDELTPWHIRLLVLFHAPRDWFAERGRPVPEFNITSNLAVILQRAFPELASRRDFYEFIVADLHRKGLVVTQGMNTSLSASGVFQSWTTELGKGLIAFISSPLPSD